MFYTFTQNNSGGGFDVDEVRGIGHVVVIEAKDEAEANYRAERIGLYFDGCSDGRDCSCCGDRWYGADEYNSGPVPTICGKPIDPGYEWFGGPTFIHPLRGQFYKA